MSDQDKIENEQQNMKETIEAAERFHSPGKPISALTKELIFDILLYY